MILEDFLDLRIATVEPGEPEPPDVPWIRIENPRRSVVEAYEARGWFYKPMYVTYLLPVPASLEEYIAENFQSRQRNKPRRLLREVPKHFALSIVEKGGEFPEFRSLYRRTIVDRPRGKDRLAEHHEEEGFDDRWIALYLRERDRLVAGVLVHKMRGHLSVAYGAFDRERDRGLDLEHYLILQVLEMAVRRGDRMMSLGMDTNRYGHHLSLRLPAYKLRIGFTPVAFDPAGRELVKVPRFDPFERGLFFYSFAREGLMGEYFTRDEPDLRPFLHHQAPPVRVHRISAYPSRQAPTD